MKQIFKKPIVVSEIPSVCFEELRMMGISIVGKTGMINSYGWKHIADWCSVAIKTDERKEDGGNCLVVLYRAYSLGLFRNVGRLKEVFRQIEERFGEKHECPKCSKNMRRCFTETSLGYFGWFECECGFETIHHLINEKRN